MIRRRFGFIFLVRYLGFLGFFFRSSLYRSRLKVSGEVLSFGVVGLGSGFLVRVFSSVG